MKVRKGYFFAIIRPRSRCRRRTQNYNGERLVLALGGKRPSLPLKNNYARHTLLPLIAKLD